MIELADLQDVVPYRRLMCMAHSILVLFPYHFEVVLVLFIVSVFLGN